MRIFPGAKLLTCGFLVTTLLIASNLPLLAQSNGDTLTELPLVARTNVPLYATFWFLSTFDTNRYGFGPPLPWNPFGTNLNAPIYFWRGNSYVVDDTGLPPEEQEQFFRTSQSENEMLATSQGTGGGGEYGALGRSVLLSLQLFVAFNRSSI